MVEPILSMFHNGVKKIIQKFSFVAEDKKPVKSERGIVLENGWRRKNDLYGAVCL